MNTEHSGFHESMRTTGAKTSQTVYSLVGVLNNLREESQAGPQGAAVALCLLFLVKSANLFNRKLR
jgi:hypothetical protein